MSSDAEEFDLHQLDDDRQSSYSYSGDDAEEHPYARKRSRKRKQAETALGPLDVYESLGESEMEEENARKRKIRRLGVDERRELFGYSQLMRTLETDHVQDVGSHIVNFHRSLVLEPSDPSDQPVKEVRKEEGAPRKTGGTRVAANLKSAWPLQPSVIQAPRFSLVDEVRTIAQRHVETQPNRHPLTSNAFETLPGPSDPSGSHPDLPNAAVNALAFRTNVLLEQVFGLLHQYRPATAPSTQLRVPPMNWEFVLDILAEHNVVDPAVIERTQTRLKSIFGSRKTGSVRDRRSPTEPTKPSVLPKSAGSASPRSYLSYLNDDLAFLDNAIEVQKRLQAKRDAQRLLLKLTRKQMSSSENGTPSTSKSPSEGPVQGSRRSESPEHVCAEDLAQPASPTLDEGERGDLKDDTEPYRASEEDSSMESGEDDQHEDKGATPEAVHFGNEGSVQSPPPVDDSPSKIVQGWVVHAPLEESEESSGEDVEEQEGKGVTDVDDVAELEADVGSGHEDDEVEDESVTSSASPSPQTNSDPLFGGDAQSDSDESESVDESSEGDGADGNQSGEDSESESDVSDSKGDDTPGERSNQDLPAEDPHVNPLPGLGEDEDMEEDEAALLTESTGGAQRRALEEEVEEDSSDEADSKVTGSPVLGDGHRRVDSVSPPPPYSTTVPKGSIRSDAGGNGSPDDEEEETDKNKETEDSETDSEADSDEPEPTHFRTTAEGRENEVEEESGPVEARELFATISRLVSVNRPEPGDDAKVSEEESASDDDDVQQEPRRRFPSASGRRSGSDGEGMDEESEWGGVAGKDLGSDSELEGSD